MAGESSKQRWNTESRPQVGRSEGSKYSAYVRGIPTEPSNLIEAYQLLKHTYRNYDTRLALRRMQALRRSVQTMNREGLPIALELLGSINFGLVDESSDVDCVLLHFCDVHLQDGECGKDCPELLFKQKELLRILEKNTQKAKGQTPFQVEFLDSINFRYIEKKIAEEDISSDMHILRFLFYRFLGRPVNRPLVIRYFERLESRPKLMREFMQWGTEALAEYIKTSDHRHSFRKYNERIQSRHLRLPKELIEELKDYLE